MPTYEDWRVTGVDDEGDPVGITWWWDEGNAEEGARAFAVWASAHGWTTGPHLHKRSVTVDKWQQVR